MKWTLNILVFIVLSCTLVVAEPNSDKKAANIFRTVMSPFCPGKLLDDCPSGQAMELRNKIRERVASGQSDADILSYLQSVYGVAIVAKPDFSGFGSLAYLAIPAFIIIGVLLIVFWLRSQRKFIDEEQQV